MNFRPALTGVVAVAALGSCGKDGLGVADVLLVATVEVTPPSGDLVIGGTAQLTAVPRTASGLAIPGRTIVWSSSAEAVVSVSSAGVITAVALGGPVRIMATVGGSVGESLITVRPVPVARVTIAPSLAGVVVGGSTELDATAYDANGDPLYDRLIFWQSSAPSIVAVTSTGIVLGISEGGPVTITATSEGKSGTALVSVTPRPATRLDFLQQPGSATAGQPITPPVRVAIQNDQGATVPAAANSVSISLSTNPAGATLSGTTTVAAVNGIATFSNLSLDRAAAGYTLMAASAGLAPATSSTFTNVAGPASRLTITTAPPASASSGVPLTPQPSLQLRDGFGNAVAQSGVVVTASVTSGAATPGGSTTATTNSAGAATFLTLSLSGSGGAITLSFIAPGLAPVAAAPITLSTGIAPALAMVTQPSAAAQSGVPFAVQPAVKLRDATGNDLNSAGVAITASIASGPAGGSLGGGTVMPTSGNGTATFTNLVISGPAGAYTLRFISSGFTPVTSSAIAVTVPVPSANRLSITTQPSSSAANGTPFAQQPVLQLRDASGNAVSQSGVAVTASIASGGGTLGGTITVSTDGLGIARFTNLSISGTIGNRTLGFSSPGLTGVTSGTVNVTAGPASQLSITSQPSSTAMNGAPFPQQPVIQLRDASGNPVSRSGVAVTVAIASGGGTLGGTTTVLTDASGTATFTNLSISGIIGSRTLRVTAPTLSGATTGTVNVTAGPATQLSITVQPSSAATSGIPLQQQPVIQLRDASGNLVSAAGYSVSAALNSGPGTLGGTLTVATAATGFAAFTNLVLTGPGSYSLVFTSGNLNQVVSIGILVN